MNQDILIRLLQDKPTFNQIIKEFPGLYSSCLTIKQNLSSEVVKVASDKVLNFYNTNEKFKLFIDSFKLITKLNENESINDNDVTGMIMILDKKEETFKKLMQTAKKEKWQYKGIAIVDQFDNIRLYFY